MTAEEALEIIVDLMAKAGSELRDHPGSSQDGHLAKALLGDIETIAISYGEMEYEVERDLVEDEGWYQGAVGLKSGGLGLTLTSSVRPSP